MASNQPTVSAIVARSVNRVIGANGDIPWHIPQDLKRFRKLTMGKICIMGRKTAKTLEPKGLDGRRCLIVSSTLRDDDGHWGEWFDTPLDALDYAHTLALCNHTIRKPEEIMIIGGGEIYEQLLYRCDRVYATVLDQEMDGDTFFPILPEDDWLITYQSPLEQAMMDGQNVNIDIRANFSGRYVTGPRYRFTTYQRRQKQRAEYVFR